jgi:hypothetical protein
MKQRHMYRMLGIAAVCVAPVRPAGAVTPRCPQARWMSAVLASTTTRPASDRFPVDAPPEVPGICASKR